MIPPPQPSLFIMRERMKARGEGVSFAPPLRGRVGVGGLYGRTEKIENKYWAGGEMADTGDLKSPGGDPMRVRVPPRLPDFPPFPRGKGGGDETTYFLRIFATTGAEMRFIIGMSPTSGRT